MIYLNIPGLNNSGPAHWQTLWEQSFPGQFLRVHQSNWEAPVRNEWVNALDAAIGACKQKIVLIAHSLGCITVAHWAKVSIADNIAGAVLVAPADTEHFELECFRSFNPIPSSGLPFPSIVVASTNDPYACIGNAARMAARWGSKFVSVGNKGHINAQSGLGHWEEGLSIVGRLTPADLQLRISQPDPVA